MIGSFLSSIGGSLGKCFGGGILSTIGRYGGRMIGNYLEHKMFHRTNNTYRFTNIKDGFHISKAEYGTPIPLIFGRMRVPGQIIWAGNVRSECNTSITKQHFKNQNLTVNKNSIALEYYANFAMALCEGEITEIGRVWFNDQVINLGEYNFRLYKGDEEQIADPLIASLSEDSAPAYRGLAYIVFERLPLADFNDMIPNLSFEITRKANINQENSVEDLVKAMVMIPGSGEYVYDTIIQKKSVLLPSSAVMSTTILNSHNHYNIANSIHSLNQLQITCQNIEWISPVVCWFGNNINARDCTIKPAVEFKDVNLSYSEEWLVGGYNRNTAYEITKDNFNNPLYGGSVNDASVVRYLTEIKKRKLNIMFYPMFFLDVQKKPWRGRLTTDPQYITNFFQKKHGYNDFILHYANLVKDHVNAFVIGSELIGLTKIRNGDNFPAIDELIKLAHLVKQIVGPNILVTYAADWSEYHHTEGGWYNLDPLWASSDIDFIGIDAYFPVTKTISSVITPEEMYNGWASGEGYDYYVDYKDNSQHPLKPEYAWKNLRYWWENKHKNPNGKTTEWQPRSKPIWFTEFGFPSINKASNQPNIFFDPKCIDGGVPRYSNGAIDFAIQRKAIRAFIEYWKTQEYIGEMFLWTWDARPYPAWPHMNFWKDGNLWEKGHWVNNKFGASSLSSILLEISYRCGINTINVDVSSVDEAVEGFVLSNQITAMNAINTLRSAYFFDICANNGEIISFEKRGYKPCISINSTSCIKISDNNFIEEVEIPQECTLSAINLHFINNHNEFNSAYTYINNETNSYINKALIRLPIVLTEDEAKNIGKLILKNAAIEDRIIKFIINANIVQLKPADFLIVQHTHKQYSIRIISTQIDQNKLIIVGIIDDRRSYFSIPTAKNQLKIKHDNVDSSLVILDMPFALLDTQTPFLAVYLRHNASATLFAHLVSDSSNKWNRISTLSPSYSVASVIAFEESPMANIFMVDNISTLLIKGQKLEQYISNDWQLAMVGEELIQFQKLEKLQDELYQISLITRGEMGTERFINQHSLNEDFVIINSGANIIPVSEKLMGQQLLLKAAMIEKSITYTNKANLSIEPYITWHSINNNQLELRWVTRLKTSSDWSINENQTNIKFTILINDKGQIHELITSKNEMIIDISEFALSDDYQISILTYA